MYVTSRAAIGNHSANYLELLAPIYSPEFVIFFVYSTRICIWEYLAFYNPLEFVTPSVYKKNSFWCLDYEIPLEWMKLDFWIREMFRKFDITNSIYRIIEMSDNNMRFSFFYPYKNYIIFKTWNLMNIFERRGDDFLFWILWS